MFNGNWTPARTAELKHLWSKGFSHGDIARHFKDVTREAVIGKLMRLGLAQKDNGRHRGRADPTPRKGPPPAALVRLAEFDPLARRLVYGAPLDAEQDAV